MGWMRHADRGRRRWRPGWLEGIAALAVIGIVVNVSIHRARAAEERELAAAVLADVRAIESAARAYHEEHGVWPPEAPRGVAPDGLVPLPDVPLAWRRPELGLTYDWENWVLSDGTPRHPGSGVACGVSIVADPGREDLLEQIARAGGATFVRPRRNRITLVTRLLSNRL
ncbi:MAG: hypothetical protein Kow0062_11670 [Acidobacteriota bacterium]